MRGPCRPSEGSSFSARARISAPRNDPELWPTTTISSASLSRASLVRYCGETVDPLVPFRPLAVGELPSPDRIRQQIEQVGRVFGVFQHRAQQRDEHDRGRRRSEHAGNAERAQPPCDRESHAETAQRLDQQHQMRIGDEGREAPVRLPEPRNGAAEHQPPVDPDRPEHRAEDWRGKVALDQILEPEEIVAGAGLPVARLGLDAPGRALAVGGGLRAADGGGELIQPAELAQFGSEHAVILRETARIVSLHIDDMAVLNAHLAMIPGLAGGLYQAA